jgi:predicted ATPase
VLTPFRFEYTFPAVNEDQLPATISFGVVPNSMPPTNVHVIIGRNGAGKTHLLGNVSFLLCQTVVPGHNHELGTVQFPRGESDTEDRFANLVAVTFSAFDPFRAPIVGSLIQGNMRYSYVGLKKRSAREADADTVPENDDTSDPGSDGSSVSETSDRGEIKTFPELTTEFEESLSACLTGPRRRRWAKAIETLESDPGFTDLGLRSSLEADRQSAVHQIAGDFGTLSSGHKIVLLTVTRLVELVEERTLVLLDEPEAHLHPPLLSSFVRVLSDLLIARNGAAIIATHSPVVLQEVPSDCVWVLRRSGGITEGSRPQIQTFGENVGVLTREIFGLEVTESGFHKLIAEKTTELDADYEAVLDAFGGRLGAEGRAIALALSRRARE